jgi:hypothetical protein
MDISCNFCPLVRVLSASSSKIYFDAKLAPLTVTPLKRTCTPAATAGSGVGLSRQGAGEATDRKQAGSVKREEIHPAFHSNGSHFTLLELDQDQADDDALAHVRKRAKIEDSRDVVVGRYDAGCGQQVVPANLQSRPKDAVVSESRSRRA